DGIGLGGEVGLPRAQVMRPGHNGRIAAGRFAEHRRESQTAEAAAHATKELAARDGRLWVHGNLLLYSRLLRSTVVIMSWWPRIRYVALLVGIWDKANRSAVPNVIILG